jgi:putative transposase
VTEEKVKLVKEHKGQYGLNTCLDAIELPKSTWYYQKKEKVVYEEKYEELKRPVLDVIRVNPGYGYRRILPDLRDGGHTVGEFVVRRMLKRWDLELLRSIRKPRLSGPRRYLNEGSKGWNLVKKIEDPQAFQVLYTDFTEIWYDGGRKKAYLMPILDHKTKWVAGWEVAAHKNTAQWGSA